MNARIIPRKKWLLWLVLAALPLGLGLYIRSQNSWRPRVIAMKNVVRSIAVSPRGDLWACGDDAGLISLGNFRSEKIARTMQANGYDDVPGLAFSPDGRILASGGHESFLSLWDTETSALKFDFGRRSQYAYSIAFAPDGIELVTSGGYGKMRFWKVDRSEANSFAGEQNYNFLNAVALSRDGKLVAGGSTDHLVLLWNASSRQLLRRMSGHKGIVNAVDFSPDGNLLVSGSNDKTVRIWNVATGKLLRTISAHTGAVKAVVFSPAGTILASCSDDQTIKLWDVTSGKLLRTLQGHTAAVKDIAFTIDGSTLISGSADKTVLLWRIK